MITFICQLTYRMSRGDRFNLNSCKQHDHMHFLYNWNVCLIVPVVLAQYSRYIYLLYRVFRD